MKARVPMTAIALVALGVGVAANAIMGPLVLGIMEPRVSMPMVNQLLGGEIVSLLVVAPLALIAAGLWVGRHRLAPALAMGPALYSIYTYFQFAVGPQFHRYPGNSERFFPLYLTLVVLGWTIAVSAWRAVTSAGPIQMAGGVRRLFGTLLILANGGFALAWIGSIAGVLTGRVAMVEYQMDETLFWLIRLMDLAFVIPIGVIIGVGLLRNARWSSTAAQAFGGLQVLLALAVAGMAVVMTIRHDPAASPVMMSIMSAMAIGLAVTYGMLLTGNRGVQVVAVGDAVYTI